MPAYYIFFLALAGLAAADDLKPMNLGTGLTLAGRGSSSSLSSRDSVCGTGMTTCDIGCMPLTGNCCGLGNGAYCDQGDSCVSDGCCPIGQVCSGPPTGCNPGRDLCGEFCVPQGTCTSGGSGGSSGDGSGSGGSGGGSGSSGSGGGSCPSGYEACDDECMPTGSVCCHNGYHCDAGQVCNTSDLTCTSGGSGGGGGSDGGGDPGTTVVNEPTSTDNLFVPTTSAFVAAPTPTASPTNPFSGGSGSGTGSGGNSGGSNGGSGSGSGNSNGNGNSNGGGGGGGGSSARPKPTAANAGVVNAPHVLAGLLAFAPLVLV